MYDPMKGAKTLVEVKALGERADQALVAAKAVAVSAGIGPGSPECSDFYYTEHNQDGLSIWTPPPPTSKEEQMTAVYYMYAGLMQALLVHGGVGAVGRCTGVVTPPSCT